MEAMKASEALAKQANDRNSMTDAMRKYFTNKETLSNDLMDKAESQYNMVMNQNSNNSNNKNYYICAGETPGVGPVYKDGDTINLMSQSGKNFAATVSTSESGVSIKVDDYEGYKEANYDLYNLIPRTSVYSMPSAGCSCECKYK